MEKSLMNKVAMIPARMGSQRLTKKNLRQINGKSLVEIAIEKCKRAECFDEVWVNSEDDEILEIAEKNDVKSYKRESLLADNISTSEDFIFDFLRNVSCSHVIQVHTIAPLLDYKEVKDFSSAFIKSNADVYLAGIEEQIECIYQKNPINFSYSEKTNSQDLSPIMRITWSITGWKSSSFLEARKTKGFGTYNGKIEIHPVSKISGHVIKDEKDLEIASRLYDQI